MRQILADAKRPLSQKNDQATFPFNAARTVPSYEALLRKAMVRKIARQSSFLLSDRS